jgi:hypothetical protein
LVEFPSDRIPQQLWPRELIWLHNVGVAEIEAPDTGEFGSLSAAAGLNIVQALRSVRVSALSPTALIESRKAILDRKSVLWTDVETQVAPFFRKGAVSLSGDEDGSLPALRREAALWHYWSPVLSGESEERKPAETHVPSTVTVSQRIVSEASALSVINNGKVAWQGELQAWLPSYKKTVVIPGVAVPARDALLLPLDIAFADQRFCRFCSGMSNSERLLYATAELTAIEYENGILSFEFYAPNAGVAVLQLERQPDGPMLAGGHLMGFEWDPESKRARLPIPAGAGPTKHMRIAVTISGPDNVASFIDTHVLVIGQTNHIVTEYSPAAIAPRSRLVVPEGWKATPQIKSPTQVAYAIDVPATRLHGDHDELRIETDGVSVSHTRVQLLRPVSIHIAEASTLHFGAAAEMVTDPPLVSVEAPNGRNITVQIRNNAPEIRTFNVALAGDGVEFSPPSTEISIGASMEREVSVHVFAAHTSPGLHAATVHISGAAIYDKPARFLVIPRGKSVSYAAELTGAGSPQAVWENSRLRAVFAAADGGRWIEFYWKESGKSFLPAEGVPLAKPVKIELQGDELVIEGLTTGLPRGGRIGNVEWKAELTEAATKYRVSETSSK